VFHNVQIKTHVKLSNQSNEWCVEWAQCTSSCERCVSMS